MEFAGVLYNRNLEVLKNELSVNGVKVANFPGHRSSPILVEDRSKFLDNLTKSFEIAHQVNCERLTVHSDEIFSDLSIKPATGSYEEKYINLYSSLKEATLMAEKEGILLLLESINPIEVKNYFLPKSLPALELVRAIDKPNLKMLFDIYHLQISEGNITETLEKNIDLIGHIHVADVPGRHEPGTGELNYEFILRKLSKIGFNGIIGFAYESSGDDDKALQKVQELTNSMLQ